MTLRKLLAVGFCVSASWRLLASASVEVNDSSAQSWRSRCVGRLLLKSLRVLAASVLAAAAFAVPIKLLAVVQGAWSTRAPMLTAQYGFGIASDTTGRIYLFGGSNGSTEVATAQRYDPSANTW